jgi:ribosomal protein S18 acetylase RimI-like enzyme
MAIIKKIKALGIVHFTETIFNRIIPSWIFRFVIGDMYELDIATLKQLNNSFDNNEFELSTVDSANVGDWKTLRTMTWNCVDPSATTNHWGYRLKDFDIADKILGGVWGGGGQFPESDLGFEIQLEDRQAWIYCAYVDSSARGRGVYKRLLAFAVTHLSDQGFENVYVVVQPWNRASTYIHKKYSLGCTGRITALRLFAISFVVCRGAAKSKRWYTTSIERKPVPIAID